MFDAFHLFSFSWLWITEVLAQVGGLGGPGTIEKCLNGGDVKMGIRLYKLLFEAIYRIKMRELEVSVLPENDQTSSLLVEVQTAKENLTHETVKNLVNNNHVEYCFKWVVIWPSGYSFL